MALYAVTAGATEVTTDVNQYKDLLTGVMTDQDVTLSRNLTAKWGVKLGTGDPGSGPDIHSQGTDIFLETNGAGAIFLRPNGYGSTVNMLTYDYAGNMGVAGSLRLGNSLVVPGSTTLATLVCTAINTAGNTVNCGGLTATSGSFSGGVGITGAVTVGGSLAVTGAFSCATIHPSFTNQEIFSGGVGGSSNYWRVSINGANYLINLST